MLAGETNLTQLLKSPKPELHQGEFVFCTVDSIPKISTSEVVMLFRETEGNTIILRKETADHLGLSYSFIASWITLTVHSSLAAVGLTAAFAKALSEKGISCNVVAAYYHDHIFVDTKDAMEAVKILLDLSK
jgi:hypothetical protein